MDETQVQAEAARKTIRRKYKALLSTVCREPFPETLYEREIIGEETLEIALSQVLTSREKGNKIMSEVKKAVQANAGLFDEFCEVLAGEGISKDLSDEIKGNCYCHIFICTVEYVSSAHHVVSAHPPLQRQLPARVRLFT